MPSVEYALQLDLVPAGGEELDAQRTTQFTTDVSRYLKRALSRRGRQDAVSPFQPGTLELELNNADGRFSPEKDTYPDLDQDVPARLRAFWSESGQLLDNPSFEEDTAGVVADGGLSVSRLSTQRTEGDWAIRVQGSAASLEEIHFRLQDGTRVPAQAGRKYTFWGDLMNDAASSGDPQMVIGLEFFDSGGSSLGTVEEGASPTFPALVAGAPWQRWAVTGTAPASTAFVEPYFREHAGWLAGRYMWFDNLRLQRDVDDVQNLCDNPSFEVDAVGPTGDHLSVDGTIETERWGDQYTAYGLEGRSGHRQGAGSTLMRWRVRRAQGRIWSIAAARLQSNDGASAPTTSGSAVVAKGAGSSLAFSFTVPSASNRCLVVGVAMEGDATKQVSSVTFGAAGLTRFTFVQANGVRVELWYLVAPTVSTNTLTVNFSSSTGGAVAGAQVWQNVLQATPFVGAATSTGTSNTASVTVSSAATTDTVIDIVGMDPAMKFSRLTTDSVFGSSCLRVEARTDDFAKGVRFRPRSGAFGFAVTAGKHYAFSCMVAPDPALSLGFFVHHDIVFYDSNQNVLTGPSFTLEKIDPGDPWVRLTKVETAPTGAVWAIPDIEENVGWNTGKALLFDGVQFCEVVSPNDPVPEPYVDGDQLASSWDGTAHASTSSRSVEPLDLFVGKVADFDCNPELASRTAVLLVKDRLADLQEQEINLGIMPDKKADVVVRRILDKLEQPELVANDSGEKVLIAGLGTSGDLTGYTALNGASLVSNLQDPVGQADFVIEGDHTIRTTPSASQSLSGWKYDLTSITAAGDKIRVGLFARTGSGTRQVYLRIVDSVGIVVSQSFNLSTTYQYLELSGTFNAGSTSREVRLIAVSAGSSTFYHDCLHSVLWKHRIESNVEAGISTLSWVFAFQEPVASLLADVASSEAGQLFVARDGVVTLHNRDWRQSGTKRPAVAIGDQTGLVHAMGMRYQNRGSDRVGKVVVTSRGTPVSDANVDVAWTLQPASRSFTAGDDIWVDFSAIMSGPVIEQTGTAAIDADNSENYGAGARLRVLTTGSFTSLKVSKGGYLMHYPAEDSRVEELVVNPTKNARTLEVSMPFQGSRTQAMIDEAERLAGKYGGRVKRMQVTLGMTPSAQGEKVVHVLQNGFELDELVVVRSLYSDEALGVDGQFWIEGIEHEISEGGKEHRTRLLLEEV